MIETRPALPFAFALALLALSTGCNAQAAERAPIVLKFSHVVAVDTPKGRAAEFFKKRAEELTGGRVVVEVHPNGTLYKDKDEMEALQLGAVQMLAPSLSKLGQLGTPEFEVFDLPFIFADYAELRTVTEGAIGKKLLGKLEGKGILGLAYWDNGFKCFSANRPLHSVADYAGLSMRVQPSAVIEAQVRALGASPQVLSFTDVEAALRAGIVDGTENPISNFVTQRMNEVQKHLSITRHGYLGYAVIVNKRFWEGLPRPVRGQLEQAMRDATAFANQLAREKNDQDLARLRASHTTQVYVPTPEERSALKAALLPVHREMEARLGKQLIQEIYVATRFDPNQR